MSKQSPARTAIPGARQTVQRKEQDIITIMHPGGSKSAVGASIGGAEGMDVLFLKRLLFLKASIDNESTLDPYGVPMACDNKTLGADTGDSCPSPLGHHPKRRASASQHRHSLRLKMKPSPANIELSDYLQNTGLDYK